MQAVQEREQALRAAQLSYTDASFHVELVQQSDVTGPATIINSEHRSALYTDSALCPYQTYSKLKWLMPNKTPTPPERYLILLAIPIQTANTSTYVLVME